MRIRFYDPVGDQPRGQPEGAQVPEGRPRGCSRHTRSITDKSVGFTFSEPQIANLYEQAHPGMPLTYTDRCEHASQGMNVLYLYKK